MKKEIAIVVVFFVVLLVFGYAMSASATWTPLVSSSDFTGITTDVTTAATGIITICIVVLGIWFAVDISGLSSGVTTIVVGLIGVTLILVGYRWARKSLGR
ncbi:MAG: hypothetical protein HY754_04395 [Nitrospirae bacterium]|nr:hypothetical protein [Nitrospirota bacterium]